MNETLDKTHCLALAVILLSGRHINDLQQFITDESVDLDESLDSQKAKIFRISKSLPQSATQSAIAILHGIID